MIEIINKTKHSIGDYNILLKKVFLFTEETFTIVFVNNKEIKKLNKDFRNVNKVTDVLSFPSGEEDYLGDVVISLKKAFKQAKTYKHSINREVAFLAVHGYLHLLGYDHETKEDEQVMFNKQEEILNNAGIKRGE